MHILIFVPFFPFFLSVFFFFLASLNAPFTAREFSVAGHATPSKSLSETPIYKRSSPASIAAACRGEWSRLAPAFTCPGLSARKLQLLRASSRYVETERRRAKGEKETAALHNTPQSSSSLTAGGAAKAAWGAGAKGGAPPSSSIDGGGGASTSKGKKRKKDINKYNLYK